MKNCRDIQWDLSAYLDGELTSPQRIEVETHLASCARCQQELSEMKRLLTDVVTLPKLQPPPRFLADVRRKIARGDEPEAPTWGDYVFRPLWLKVPLEVAALVVIVGLVMRLEHPLATQKTAPLKLARAETGEKTISSYSETKTATANEPGSTSADLAPAAGPRRIPVVRSGDELSIAPPAAPSPVVGVIRSMELARSERSETVTVHARDFDDVRNRARQLAPRCGGRVVSVPQSKDAPEQTLFVELPQEYVAAFKLELLKTPGSSAASTKSGDAGLSGLTNAAAVPTGVLTGKAATNTIVDGLAPVGVRDDSAGVEPKTVLEIRVVAPAN